MSCTERRMYAFKSDATTNVLGAGYKFGSSDKHVAKGAAKSDKVIGFCQDEAGNVKAVGDPLTLAIRGGGAKALAHGTITRGNELTFDGTGLVEAASGDWVSAVAMASAVSGDIFPVEVVGYFKA